MRWVRFLFLLWVVAILDAGNLLRLIEMPGLPIRPDLLLIFLVFMASNLSGEEAIITAFVIGFAADASGETGLMGPYTISFTVFGTLISQLRRVVLMRRMIYQGLMIFILTMFTRGSAQLLIVLRGEGLGSNAYTVLWRTAAYSAVVGPFLWIALSGLGGWLGLPRYPHLPPHYVRR